MVRAFISVGSNINPADNVQNALRALARSVRVLKISTVYLTRAEGRPDQPDFYNCVVEVDTDIPASELKSRVLRAIESAQGRRRSSDKYAPRAIDLDLIIYGEMSVDSGELILPDPDISSRAFLAVPLAELEPAMVIPGTRSRVSEIAAAFRGHTMTALPEYTASLISEVCPSAAG